MNNKKRTVPPAFIAVCGEEGKSGSGSQKRGIAVSDMPLVLAMEACMCASLDTI